MELTFGFHCTHYRQTGLPELTMNRHSSGYSLLISAVLLTVAGCGASNDASDHGIVFANAVDRIPCDTGRVIVAEPNRRNNPIPIVNKPRKGERFLDPTYGSCITRISDHRAEPPQDFSRNDYSRRQAFNADSSLLLAYGHGGTWHLYDSISSDYLQQLPELRGDAEPQWHPDLPNVLFYLPENGIGMTIHELDVGSGQSRVVGDLSHRVQAIWPNAAVAWTRSEGSPSADARYWALLIQTAEFVSLGLVVWDRVTDTIVASLDVAGEPDYISMSPSGQRVVLGGPAQVVSYDQQLRNPVSLHAQLEHSDLAVDASGNDVYVAVDFDLPGGALFMANLDSGERTLLLDTYINGSATSYHLSGKSFDQPGWIVMSTHSRTSERPQWLHEKILLVELASDPRVYQIADHHSQYEGYWTEPHASVNRDLSQIVFNSNWNQPTDLDIDVYRVEVPDGPWTE